MTTESKQELSDTLGTRVTKEMRDAFGHLAAQRHQPASYVVREAMREYLAKPENKTPAQLPLELSKGEAA